MENANVSNWYAKSSLTEISNRALGPANANFEANCFVYIRGIRPIVQFDGLLELVEPESGRLAARENVSPN